MMNIKNFGSLLMTLSLMSAFLLSSTSYAADMVVKDVAISGYKGEGNEVRARFRQTESKDWMLLCFYRPELLGEYSTICSAEDSWFNPFKGPYPAQMTFENEKQYGDRLIIDSDKNVLLSSEELGAVKVGTLKVKGLSETLVFPHSEKNPSLRVTDSSVTVYIRDKQK